MNDTPHIPDHTLLRPIGRGAYGEVWLARNVMGASRAVKLIWRRQFESERPYDREFAGIQRFEPVSRSSSGLVHVLHVGRNDAEGYFYYVMELADAAEVSTAKGQASGEYSQPASHLTPDTGTPETYQPRTLRSDLNHHGHLPTADCIRLALDLVGGLAQLHFHGLVHRDVKPGNIIYVHGRAKLADIGLVSDREEGRTFVGTEGYIPPEGPGAPAADLYALGIALYEASTGYPPEKFPDVPPEWLADDASTEALEFHEIILKACEGQRERRYESAEIMQADLALLQSGQSVRRVRALEQRYTRLRFAGVVGTILLACALWAVFFASYRARLAAQSRAKEAQLREQAQTSLARAETAERDAREQLYTALLGEARAVVSSGELGHRVKALDALRRAAAISNNMELRREVFAALALPDWRFERELLMEPDVSGVELAPDFDRMAICRGKSSVEIRAVSDSRLLTSLPACTNLPSYGGLWSPDGKYFAVKRDRTQNGRRAELEIWDVAEQRRALHLTDISWETRSFHPQQPWFMAAQPDGVAIWDLVSGRELKRFPFSKETVHLAAFSPDGDRYAAHQVFSTQSVVTVRSAIDGAVMMSRGFPEFVGALAWHPGGQRLAIADHGGGVRLLDAQTGDTLMFGLHKAQAASVAFTPDGQYLTSGGWERELICWDVHTGRREFSIALNAYILFFSADGRRCATIERLRSTQTFIRSLKLHAFERPVAHREFDGYLGSRLVSAAFSPDGRWLAASASKRAGVWDLSRHGPGAFDEEAYDARFCFTPDAREIFGSRTESKSKGFRWRMAAATDPDKPPQLTRLPLASSEGLTSIGISSNSFVVTGPKGSQLLSLHEIETGNDRWVRTSPGFNGISPDGKWLAIYRGFNDLLFIHRLPGLEGVATLKHSGFIGDFKFSPLGDEVVTSSTSGAVFWSTTTWKTTRSTTNVLRLIYTPDARALWLWKDWHMGGLHDAQTLELLLPLPTGTLPLALSPDGLSLAVSVDLRRLQVWNLAELRKQFVQLGLDWRD